MAKLKGKNVKITTDGNMNGTWNIEVRGIRDEDLYDAEVKILALFGKKKKKRK